MHLPLKNLITQLTTALATVALATAVPTVAHAAVNTADVSGLNLTATPLVTYQGVSVMQDMACFDFASSDPDNNQVRFNDLIVTGKVNSSTVTVSIPTLAYTPNEGSFSVCTVDENGNPLADLGNPLDFTTIWLSGKTVLNSSISSSFGDLLKANGLAMDPNFPAPGFNYNPYNGTQFWAQIKNPGKKTVALKISNVKFDGIALDTTPITVVVATGANSYLNLGGVSADVSGGHPNADLTAKITKLTLSTTTVKGITAPKGVKVSFTPTDWYYFGEGNSDPDYNNKSGLCLNLTNTTTKPIAIEAKLAFSATGKKGAALQGSSVDVIPAGASICVTGAYDERLHVAGDWRIASTVTVTGSLAIVSASTVASSGIKLPAGFKVAGSWFAYDSKTKKTAVSVQITAPADFQNDLKFSSVIADGKKLASSVSGACQCGGPGYVNSRFFRITGLSGDLRIGKKVTAAATATISTPTNLVNNVTFNDNNLACTPYYPQEWDYSAASDKTSITVICFNNTGKDGVVDVSGLRMTVTTDAGSTEYSPVASKISVAANASPTNVVKVFVATGDLRSGGATVEITGSLK